MMEAETDAVEGAAVTDSRGDGEDDATSSSSDSSDSSTAGAAILRRAEGKGERCMGMSRCAVCGW